MRDLSKFFKTTQFLTAKSNKISIKILNKICTIDYLNRKFGRIEYSSALKFFITYFDDLHKPGKLELEVTGGEGFIHQAVFLQELGVQLDREGFLLFQNCLDAFGTISSFLVISKFDGQFVHADHHLVKNYSQGPNIRFRGNLKTE